MSMSAPSAINMEYSVVKFVTERDSAKNAPELHELSNQNTNSEDSMHVQNPDLNLTTHEWQSLSCLTDSTEQSAPINFDMSNRAKLPRGIDNIRPHIELIDNVPLLVSLFTDCAASVTREMLHIMQDYGEVVCVMGSSANCDNAGIFMQADASIAVEPLYPQVCQKMEAYKPSNVESGPVSPVDLSRILNSVACSLSVRREDPISFYHLIMEARHYMLTLWNSVQFWLCCCVTISFTQVLATVFLLPPILTPGQVLWFVCLVIPVLSISLMGTATDVSIMKKPLCKIQIDFNSEAALFVLWSYGIKFLPVVFIVLITFVSTLANYCTDFCFVRSCTCAFFYIPTPAKNATIHDEWHEQSDSLLSARQVVIITIFLHLVTISCGFVHREFSMRSRGPHSNLLWLSAVIMLLILQTLYTLVNLNQSAKKPENDFEFEIANSLLAFVFLSPLITFAINELIKYLEIKVNLRYQRRARLDFGTKLGMNSPF